MPEAGEGFTSAEWGEETLVNPQRMLPAQNDSMRLESQPKYVKIFDPCMPWLEGTSTRARSLERGKSQGSQATVKQPLIDMDVVHQQLLKGAPKVETWKKSIEEVKTADLGQDNKRPASFAEMNHSSFTHHQTF